MADTLKLGSHYSTHGQNMARGPDAARRPSDCGLQRPDRVDTINKMLSYTFNNVALIYLISEFCWM